jgi:hypothetical protein
MADNYTIIGQKPNIAINPAGVGFQEVWEISYRVTDGPSKGTVATITVPDSDHNAAYVKQAIEDKIKALNAVASL